MGYINKITAPDPGNFPAAVFEQEGSVPIAQCQETQITFVGAIVQNGLYTVTKTDAFLAIDLTGKKVTITAPAGDAGTYNILSNTDTILTTDHQFIGDGPLGDGTVQDAGQAYLTRNVKSFAEFIHDNGYAYTIKGGKLHTDCPNGTLLAACSDTWNPGE